MFKQSTWWLWLLMAALIALDVAEVIVSKWLIAP